MRGAEGSFHRGARFWREDIAERGLEIIDQDLVEEDVGRVDKGDAEVLPHQVMGAVDDFRVCPVLRGKNGGLCAELDLLRDYGGTQIFVVDGVGATKRLEQ